MVAPSVRPSDEVAPPHVASRASDPLCYSPSSPAKSWARARGPSATPPWNTASQTHGVSRRRGPPVIRRPAVRASGAPAPVSAGGGPGRAAGRDHWSGDPVTRVEFSPSHRAGQHTPSRCDRGPRSGNPTAQSAAAAHLRAVRAAIAPRRSDIRRVPARFRTTAPGLSRAPEIAASKPSGVSAHRSSEVLITAIRTRPPYWTRATGERQCFPRTLSGVTRKAPRPRDGSAGLGGL